MSAKKAQNLKGFGWSQARTLSKTALEAAETSLGKAQSSLILARASHSAGLKAEARFYYSQVFSPTRMALHMDMCRVFNSESRHPIFLSKIDCRDKEYLLA